MSTNEEDDRVSLRETQDADTSQKDDEDDDLFDDVLEKRVQNLNPVSRGLSARSTNPLEPVAPFVLNTRHTSRAHTVVPLFEDKVRVRSEVVKSTFVTVSKCVYLIFAVLFLVLLANALIVHYRMQMVMIDSVSTNHAAELMQLRIAHVYRVLNITNG